MASGIDEGNRGTDAKKNLERIKIPVLIFIAGNDHMVDNRAIAVFVKSCGYSFIGLYAGIQT